MGFEEINDTYPMTYPVKNSPENADYEPWAVTFLCIGLASLSGLGAAGNVVNIKTFLSLGISDGVNMSLISLAASDLLFLTSAFVNSFSLMLHGVEELTGLHVWFPVDPEAVYTIFANTSGCFYANSMLVTTFITVVRCLAVANPLRFRKFLSCQTTAIIIWLFAVVSVTFAVLLLYYLGIFPQFDSKINTTRPILWISPQRTAIKNVLFGIRDVFLPLASQILVGICVVVMAIYLQEASEFRLKNSRQPDLSDHITQVKHTTQESSSAKMAGKELQVVQHMLLIAIVYSLCNMSKVVFNLTQIILPDFYRGGRYSAVYVTCNMIREMIQSVNASVHIFIYLSYNSKFRSHCILHK